MRPALFPIDTVAVTCDEVRLVVLVSDTPETCIVGARVVIPRVVEPVKPNLSRT